MRSKLRYVSLLMIAWLVSTGACGGEDTGMPDPEPGENTPEPGDGSDPTGTPDTMEPPTTSLLTGKITRTVAPSNTGDAAGNLYVFVFDDDPLSSNSFSLVAYAVTNDIDMSEDGAEIAYEVTNIDPSAEDYYVVAILDENTNIDLEAPETIQPDRGDLFSAINQGLPAIKLESPGMYELDLVLNTVWQP